MSAVALLLVSTALAKNKVRHDDVVPPQWAVPAVDAHIGTVTDMKAAGDLLVLGGQEGVAAVDASGAVKWATPLPWAMVRNVAVDGTGVAFTDWTLGGIEDKAKALNLWASGKLLDKFEVTATTVGALGQDGALLWSHEAAEKHPIAPPGLGTDAVVVNLGTQLVAYGRADGAEVGRSEMPGTQLSGGMFKGVFDHGTRGEVVPVGDGFFTSFFSYLVRTDAHGAIQDKEFKAGLTPYVDITCGPVELGDLLVFGTTGDTNVANAFFAMKPDMKNKWKLWSPDKISGCGDIAVAGDVVVASSNFHVLAIDDKGKIAWDAVNKKGGLYPSSNRGVRYVGNFGARKTYGDLLVVGGGRVFVGTDHDNHDVLTVLDVGSGEYVHTIDVNEPIVSLAVVGSRLAVATETGLHLMDIGA